MCLCLCWNVLSIITLYTFYGPVFFFVFWMAKNVVSSILKNDISEQSGSKNNPRVLKVSQKLTFSKLTLMSWSHIMNPFSSLLKDCSFRWFRAENYSFFEYFRMAKVCKEPSRSYFFPKRMSILWAVNPLATNIPII